jgi:hypothetical protein
MERADSLAYASISAALAVRRSIATRIACSVACSAEPTKINERHWRERWSFRAVGIHSAKGAFGYCRNEKQLGGRASSTAFPRKSVNPDSPVPGTEINQTPPPGFTPPTSVKPVEEPELDKPDVEPEPE